LACKTYQWYKYNTFDAQAWLVRDYTLGNALIPSREEMQKSWSEWRAREEALDPDYHDQINFQGDYVKHLIGMTDYPSFDIEAVNKTFFEWYSCCGSLICDCDAGKRINITGL
jgi:trimethylamine monooxygenase